MYEVVRGTKHILRTSIYSLSGDLLVNMVRKQTRNEQQEGSKNDPQKKNILPPRTGSK